MTTIQTKIYRFVFSDCLQGYFATFAEEYCELDRKEFKQKWEEWITVPLIRNTIQDEIVALRDKGFDGDVLDKMFKCVRYYFRKKAIQEISISMDNQSIKEENTDTKWMSHLSKAIIQKIDTHIREQTNTSISPYDRYDLFYKENMSLFRIEFEKIIPVNHIGEKDRFDEFVKKIKKSYKNRIYKQPRSPLVA